MCVFDDMITENRQVIETIPKCVFPVHLQFLIQSGAISVLIVNISRPCLPLYMECICLYTPLLRHDQVDYNFYK